MSSKRGNPVTGKGSPRAIHQSVVNPVADSSNTDVGNPAALRVTAGKKRTLHKGVNHPSVREYGPTKGKM